MNGRAEDGPRDPGVIGVNHRTAPIQIRERFHRGAAGVRRALEETGASSIMEGTVILSTCNRVELYLSAPSLDEAVPVAEGLLAERSGLSLEEARPYLYAHRGRAAVEHLHRVVAGLDSLVPGEAEIQGQVGDAYDLARLDGSGDVDPVLHRLFQDALSAGGEVRAETTLGQGAASVPSAAVDLARKVFGDLGALRAMVVGAGAMGRLTMECLAAEGVRHAAVASRTEERARALAREVGGEAVPLESVPELLEDVDIVVSCTGAETPVLVEDDLADRGREGVRPLVILDIAVPRDVESEMDRLPGIFLYNIDDLQRVVEGTEESRLSEVPRAEEILRDSVEEFCRWHRARQAVPLIRELRGRARALRDRAVEDLLSDLERSAGPDGLGEAERQRIREAFRVMVNRLIHEPTVALREGAARPDGDRYLDAMRRLFDLETGTGRRDPRDPDDRGSITRGTEERSDG